MRRQESRRIIVAHDGDGAGKILLTNQADTSNVVDDMI
jgi:hypothetical protein